MRIDAHHHLWDLARRPQPWTAGLVPLQRSFALSDLEPALAAAGIDKTIVVQTGPSVDETRELLEAAAGGPTIAGVVGWINLLAGDSADQLSRLADSPGGDRLVGIRHQVEAEQDVEWLLRPRIHSALDAIERAGLGYDLLVRHAQLPSAIAVARRHPGLRFVLDHAAKPNIAKAELDPWRSLIGSIAALPNVSVKLSGLTTQASPSWTASDLAPYVDVLLGAFGPNRMMFGSDWPVCLLAGSYTDMDGAIAELLRGLTPDELEDVRWRTAARWYSLDILSPIP